MDLQSHPGRQRYPFTGTTLYRLSTPAHVATLSGSVTFPGVAINHYSIDQQNSALPGAHDGPFWIEGKIGGAVFGSILVWKAYPAHAMGLKLL